MVHVATREYGVLHHLRNRFVRRAGELDRSNAVSSVEHGVCVVVEEQTNEALCSSQADGQALSVRVLSVC